MLYHDFQDLKLSALGMGAMRLPVIDGQDDQIDEPATQKMVAYAMEHGINYYDTAWGYHHGHSEEVMGRVLKNYPRQQFYLASKFPGYDLANMPHVKTIFSKQLEKCQVEYFDFYLFHNVCEMNIDAYLDPQYGIFDYLCKMKQEGKIRHLGFSTHGNLETMRRFLQAYGDKMEFCQIQLNYLDYLFQDAKEKIALLQEYHIPVWVMEPLRGGKLATLETKYEKTLQALRPHATIPSWAFRFLQSIDSVTVVLSGMSNFQQLNDNIDTFSDNQPLNQQEWDTLLEISKEMTKQKTLPCTQCHYCTSHCPMQLDIPALISLYNEHCFTEGGFIAPMALSSYPDDKKPGACIQCHSCEAVCPQQIRISQMMMDFNQKLG